VQAADNGTIIVLSPSVVLGPTITLPTSSTVAVGFSVWLINTSNTTMIVATSKGDTFDTGTTQWNFYPGMGIQLFADPAVPGWRSIGQRALHTYAENFQNAAASYPAAGGAGAIALGSTSSASGSNSFAVQYGSTAASSYSSAIGMNSGANGAQTTSGAGAMALGGSYASGTDSFAAAISNNTSSFGSTTTGAVSIGNSNLASGVNSVALGTLSTASNSYSFAFGYSPTAAGWGSVAIGAIENIYSATTGANAYHALAFGAGANSIYRGKLAFSSGDLIATSTYQQGLQTGIYNGLRAQTTSTTATVLTTDSLAASNTNQVVLPNTSAYAFTGTVVARQQSSAGTASAAWTISGLIRREANAASTTLVASTVTAISNVPGWTLALSADTTNGALAITATGAASTNIRWVAYVQTSEVIY
jgi:hypothetical protein